MSSVQDPFAVVFGGRHGASGSDALDAWNPSSRAIATLDELLDGLGSPQGRLRARPYLLNLLNRDPDDELPPLLQRLRVQVSLLLREETLAQWHQTSQVLLNATGIRATATHTLIKGESGHFHVVPALASRFGTVHLAHDAGSLTSCTAALLKRSGHLVLPVERGLWHERPDRRCQICRDIDVSAYPEIQLEQSETAAEEWPRGLLTAFHNHLERGLLHAFLLEPDNYTSAAHQCFRTQFVAAATELAQQQGERAAQRVLPRHEYWALSEELQTPLLQAVMDASFWTQLLESQLPAAPETLSDGRIVNINSEAVQAFTALLRRYNF